MITVCSPNASREEKNSRSPGGGQKSGKLLPKHGGIWYNTAGILTFPRRFRGGSTKARNKRDEKTNPFPAAGGIPALGCRSRGPGRRDRCGTGPWQRGRHAPSGLSPAPGGDPGAGCAGGAVPGRRAPGAALPGLGGRRRPDGGLSGGCGPAERGRRRAGRRKLARLSGRHRGEPPSGGLRSGIHRGGVCPLYPAPHPPGLLPARDSGHRRRHLYSGRRGRGRRCGPPGPGAAE